MASNCIRCGGSLIPPRDSGVPAEHSLNLCHRKWSMEKNGRSLWPNFTNIGTPQDPVGDYHGCDDLLTRHDYLRTAKQGTNVINDITKHAMEKAFRRIYNSDGSKAQPPAPRTTSRGGLTQSHATHPRGSNRGRFQHTRPYSSRGQGSGRGTSAPRASISQGQRFTASGQNHDTSTGSRELSQPENLASQKSAPECLSDVYNGRPSQQLKASQPIRSMTNTKGDHIEIVTNYVAVNGLPGKVYRYAIEFGEMYAESSPTEKSPVTQRSVRGLALNEFCRSKSFRDRPFGTDGTTFWCLEELGAEDQSAQNVIITKLSGRRFIVTNVMLTLDSCITLHDSQSYKPGGNIMATRNLVNSLSVPGSEQSALRATALNALFSHYAHHRHQSGQAHTGLSNHDHHSNSTVMVDGPNKIFLAGGYHILPHEREDWLVMLRGYFTSIRPGQDRPLLNVNTATSAFFKPMKLSDIYISIKGDGSLNYPPPERLLRGLRVSIAYQREQHGITDPNIPANRHRVITEFGKPPGEQTFKKGDVEETVMAHFQEMGFRISDSTLPCANVGAKLSSRKTGDATAGQNNVPPQVWIPLEFLNLDQGQRFPKVLQGRHSEMMIKAAVRRPPENQCLIVEEGFQCLGIHDNSGLQEKIGLKLDSGLLRIGATMLTPPSLLYARNKHQSPFNGSWNLRGLSFLEPPPSDVNWIYALDFCPNQFLYGAPEKHDFMLSLDRAMQGHSMKCSSHPDAGSRVRIANPRSDNELKQLFGKEQWMVKQASLLIVFVPTRQKQLYGMIKRVFDQALGMPTVCVSEMQFRDDTGRWKMKNRQFMGPNPQLYSNLAMKINIKLGGRNHMVVGSRGNSSQKTPSSFNAIEAETIVLGADVTHVSCAGHMNVPSIAAVVGSYGKSFVNFRGAVRLQPSRQEIISSLHEMVLEHMTAYYKMRKELPKRVIFYRDGVGEDQFSACLADELPEIKKGFDKAKELCPSLSSSTVMVCFIVAGKRHNTRFYATKSCQQHITKGGQNHGKYVPNGNFVPGLLVDSVITRPEVGDGIYDFFLQSHAAIQGTARSAHYTVLTPGGLGPSDIVQLTYAFCHNYQRATKAVSYPAPAYYADRLCARASLYLEGAIERIANGTEAEKDQLNKTAEELALPKDEAQSQMARRLVALCGPRWLAPGRQNPWHENMDRIMFWL